MTDGSPLELTTRVEQAFVRGRRVDLRNKQLDLEAKGFVVPDDLEDDGSDMPVWDTLEAGSHQESLEASKFAKSTASAGDASGILEQVGCGVVSW